ncbi:hypothetical protein CPTG_00129 [Cyanophage Syn2]|uniref:Loader of gp41 DNA helicase n=2 Tax=Pontusvirus syn19 TaxID=2734134 RepID=M4SMC8_9CAUD|nr:hypothetical protein CPTG_00129 [Cyanophage Syn2]
MTGFEVYKMYLALKQHFTKQDYDYFKYRGKVRANEKSFEQRRDRYFFKKLATKYSDAELLSYFVANFVNDSKGYLQSFSKDIYTDWKINQESFTYKFKQDVNTLLDDYQIPYDQAFEKLFVVECGHPPIIKHYLGGSISLETLVVFEKCLGFVSNFDKKLSDPIWKEVRTKTLKYKPFLTIDCQTYKRVLLETIRTKL